MMIKGFDRAVADMEIGQIKDIHLMPEEAYGLPDPNAIFHVEISQLPGAEELEEGQQFTFRMRWDSHSRLRLWQRKPELLRLMQTMRWRKRIEFQDRTCGNLLI